MREKMRERMAQFKKATDLCKKEFEERFGGPPDQPVSNRSFEEKPFGSTDVVCDDLLASKIVSLALYDGDKLLFACSGVAIQPITTTRPELSRFVTSKRLVTEFEANRNRADKLRITVRLPDKTSINGFLGLYDSHLAIVTSFCFTGVLPVDLHSHIQGQHAPLVAVGPAFSSGTLMTTDRHLTEFPSEGDLILFPCPVTEAGLGGPVIDLAGEVLGLSIDIIDETTLILPLMALRERLEYLDKFIPNSTNFREYTLPEDVHNIVPSGFMKHVKYIIAGGYPKPPPLMLKVSGRLHDTFEEFFGQLLAYKGCCCNINHRTSGEEVWAKLPKGVVTNISRRVVTLSSYDGDVRAFACTGLLIKWHKNGTPVILTSASLVRSRVDADKIDENFKAGIGGPLVNFVNGSFAGMNFYDRTNRTPYLPRRFIVRALSRVDLPSQRGINHPTDIMGDATVKKNRWPVPKPYWYHPMYDNDPPLRFVGRVLH